MFWTFASPKGGTGVSVLAAAVACDLAKDQPVVLVDFGGDQADIFGFDQTDDSGAGISEWLSADSTVGISALANVEVDVRPRLQLIPAGGASIPGDIEANRCAELVAGLADRMVVADLGVLGSDPFSCRSVIAAASDRTTLVIRACYLALRRAQRLPVEVDDVVEIVEGGRALSTLDIEVVLDRHVSARIPFDPAVARAADAGLLAHRLPRSIRRAVRDLTASNLVAQ